LHDAVHLRDRAKLRRPDDEVFAFAVAEGRILITENAGDFRRLAARIDLHPGLIVLPSIARLAAQSLVDKAIAYLVALDPDRPEDRMVNACLTVREDGAMRLEPWP
jgi:predicted nuclease of predicted toxin-antitoxin system